MHESGKATGRNQAIKSDETRKSPSRSLLPSKSSKSKQESSYFFAQLLLLAVCSSQRPQTTWCQRQCIQAPQSTWNRHGSLLRFRLVFFSFLDFFKGALLWVSTRLSIMISSAARQIEDIFTAAIFRAWLHVFGLRTNDASVERRKSEDDSTHEMLVTTVLTTNMVNNAMANCFMLCRTTSGVGYEDVQKKL